MHVMILHPMTPLDFDRLQNRTVRCKKFASEFGFAMLEVRDIEKTVTGSTIPVGGCHDFTLNDTRIAVKRLQRLMVARKKCY